jgi:hypothetical protein
LFGQRGRTTHRFSALRGRATRIFSDIKMWDLKTECEYYRAEAGRDCSGALLSWSRRTGATIRLARGSVMRAVALALIEQEIPTNIAVWSTA